MINLEKIKWEKCHSSPPLKKTCYCTVLSPPFKKILRFSLTLIEVIKIYSLPPPFKKKGEGGGANYDLPEKYFPSNYKFQNITFTTVVQLSTAVQLFWDYKSQT